MFTVVGLTRHQVAIPVAIRRSTSPCSTRRSCSSTWRRRPPASQIARGTGGASRDTVNAVVARLAPSAIARQRSPRPSAAGSISPRSPRRRRRLILTRSLVDRARRQIGLFTSLLLVVSAVIIALIIYTMTMEKLKQIATLKLIGAPDRTIIGMIVQQALALGLIGFAIGATLIVNIKDYFPAPCGARAGQRPRARAYRVRRLPARRAASASAPRSRSIRQRRSGG